MSRYTVLLTPEPHEGGYSASVPALPGLRTQGDSFREAIDNARSAIKFHLECLSEEGEPIPEEAEEQAAGPTFVQIEV